MQLAWIYHWTSCEAWCQSAGHCTMIPLCSLLFYGHYMCFDICVYYLCLARHLRSSIIQVLSVFINVSACLHYCFIICTRCARSPRHVIFTFNGFLIMQYVDKTRRCQPYVIHTHVAFVHLPSPNCVILRILPGYNIVSYYVFHKIDLIQTMSFSRKSCMQLSCLYLCHDYNSTAFYTSIHLYMYNAP